MKKNILFLLTVVIFVIAGYFIFTKTSRPVISPTGDTISSSTNAYANESKWKIWQDGFYNKTTDGFFGYEFQYPRDFDVYSGDRANGYLLPQETPLVQVRFPQDAYREPKSNFGEAYMTISYSTSTKDCYQIPYDPALANLQDVDINGVSWRFGTTTGVGAGQIYDSKVYRTISNDRCFEAVLTVHTGNIGNYEPPVQEFDKSKAFSILGGILNSFKFYGKSGPGP